MANKWKVRQNKRLEDWRKQEAEKLVDQLETMRKARAMTTEELRLELQKYGLFLSYGTLFSWRNRLRMPGVITIAALRPALEAMRIDWLNEPNSDYDLAELIGKED